MVFVPALVALALTAVTDGGTGVRALLGKLGQWRLRLGWVQPEPAARAAPQSL